MKKIAALSLSVLLAPALALSGPPGLLENTKVQYLISTQLLKDDGTVMHQGLIRTWAGALAPLSSYTETPYIARVSRSSDSPGKTKITREVLKTGFAYSVTCSPVSPVDSGTGGDIACLVQGDVAENTNPRLTAQDTQDDLEKSIKQGANMVTLPQVERQVWNRTVAVRDGEESVLTMGQYQFKLKVQAL